MSRRKRALLVYKFHSDMHRYLGYPVTISLNDKEVWIKPDNVTNVWLEHGVGRFRSFCIRAEAGFWDGTRWMST
jgi:hypothetical protein